MPESLADELDLAFELEDVSLSPVHSFDRYHKDSDKERRGNHGENQKSWECGPGEVKTVHSCPWSVRFQSNR